MLNGIDTVVLERRSRDHVLSRIRAGVLEAGTVALLSRTLLAHYSDGEAGLLARYPEHVLARIWNAVRFSWSMTTLLHSFPQASAFDRRIQQSEPDYLSGSASDKRPRPRKSRGSGRKNRANWALKSK